MLGFLASLFGGPLISGILDAFKAKLATQDSAEAHAVDLAKAELVAEAQARANAKEIIIAEQGYWFSALPRPLFALIVLVYMGKVVIWDSVLGWGSTPAINGAVGEWLGWIVAAYFGGRTVEKVAQIIKR
jgi:hypothetical protein